MEVYSSDVEVCLITLTVSPPHEEKYLLAVPTCGALAFDAVLCHVLYTL